MEKEEIEQNIRDIKTVLRYQIKSRRAELTEADILLYEKAVERLNIGIKSS
jgi:hypothetical protein